jgi:transcriptional regulator with XRE-family HTH domain
LNRTYQSRLRYGSHGKSTTRPRRSRQGKGAPGSKVTEESAAKNAIAALRARLRLSQAVFARLLPVSVRTLATLESGTQPGEVVARRLTELRRLTHALTEVIKETSLGQWLQAPNQAFDGLKPIEVIERGEADRIWSMIYFLRSGVAS